MTVLLLLSVVYVVGFAATLWLHVTDQYCSAVRPTPDPGPYGRRGDYKHRVTGECVSEVWWTQLTPDLWLRDGAVARVVVWPIGLPAHLGMRLMRWMAKAAMRQLNAAEERKAMEAEVDRILGAPR